jgi:putative toxin-antitoxin system antitoxin component (TIGR02293 family)
VTPSQNIDTTHPAPGLAEAGASFASFSPTADLLGGARVLHRRIDTGLEAHDALEAGLPSRALDALVSAVDLLKSGDNLERALGLSERTWYRHKSHARPLSREQSGRVWKFAEILARSSAVFGSQSAAEAWLEAPAIGLDQRRPLDLFSTPAGVELLETWLTRVEFGVYA